jgi:hypothetical protein
MNVYGLITRTDFTIQAAIMPLSFHIARGKKDLNTAHTADWKSKRQSGGRGEEGKRNN